MYKKDIIYKAFVKGNYFYLIDTKNSIEYKSHTKDVVITPKREDSIVYFIYNLKYWRSEVPISISNIQNESGVNYTKTSFENFYTSFTGTSDISGLATESSLQNLAKETTLQSLVNLQIPEHDSIDLAYNTNGDIQTVIYSLNSGVVLTLTLSYDSNFNLINVSKS